MKTVHFLIQTPLSERDYRRFGVDRIRARGLDVAFWDLSELLNPGNRAHAEMEKHPYPGVHKVATLDALEARCRDSVRDTALIVDITGARPELIGVYKLLRSLGVPLALFRANALPTNTRRGSRLVSAARDLGRAVKIHILRLLRPGCSPAYILAGGLKSVGPLPFPTENAQVVRAHSLDYDIYLDVKERLESASKARRKAVFLDEYYPLHPDFGVRGAFANPYADYRDYYRELRAFFEAVEAKFGLAVDVAAHPRARYEDLPDLFGGRKVIKGRTEELVAGSELVLAHASTSINYAVLFEKPVLFLLPEKVAGHFFEHWIRRIAGELGKTPWRLEDVAALDPGRELAIDRARYRAYREDYIKTAASPEKHFWDIVVDALEGRQATLGPKTL